MKSFKHIVFKKTLYTAENKLIMKTSPFFYE
jgi:hypothetical protein